MKTSFHPCQSSPSSPPLTVSTLLQHQSLRCSSVHKIHGMITLNAADAGHGLNSPSTSPPSSAVDFVVAIDVSASMREDSKLAAIEFLMTVLDDRHTFTLVAFNNNVRVLAELLPCTADNKEVIRAVAHSLEAGGTTNISEALFVCTEILERRSCYSQNRVSTLMLFTDGLSIRGLSTQATLSSLDKIILPQGCVFNTFGFGADHDSKLLHSIAHKAQGVYYFVETREAIASTFGECVAGLLSTRAHQITVTMTCADGARLVTLATPFKITEKKVAKEYAVSLELMYRGESKTILFRLSLRSMPLPMNSHPLFKVTVDYTNTMTGRRESIAVGPVCVVRPAVHLLERIPILLDQHINRFTAANAITEAIDKAKQYQIPQAVMKLKEVIDSINRSPSGPEPYCLDLVSDLQDCCKLLSDQHSFETRGIHTAHALASMYFMERSSGISYKLGDGRKATRHIGYGYTTAEQESAARDAIGVARAYVHDYRAFSDVVA